MFNDPNELTVRLDDLDGAIIAMRKLADAGRITREMSDGTKVTRKPLLAQVLVFDGDRATSETTLVFPQKLKETIENSDGFVIGTLAKEPHPSKDGWFLWEIHKLSGEVRDRAVEAFSELV